VHINDRQPFTGRFLNDISVGGVSLVYLSEASPTRKPLETGQTIFLHFGDKARVSCEFVRVFEGDFATKLDFDLGI
jgi:hypothetical protein